MKAGEVTDVIRTKQGYVILKVTDHQMAGIPPMKEIEPKIQDALYYEKLQPALRAYLTKLREEAYIDIMPGYVDSGASPNQTSADRNRHCQAIRLEEAQEEKEAGHSLGARRLREADLVPITGYSCPTTAPSRRRLLPF